MSLVSGIADADIVFPKTQRFFTAPNGRSAPQAGDEADIVALWRACDLLVP